MDLSKLLNELRKEHKLKNDEMEDIFLPRLGSRVVVGDYNYKVIYHKSNPLRFTAELTAPTLEALSWMKKCLIILRILWTKWRHKK